MKRIRTFLIVLVVTFVAIPTWAQSVDDEKKKTEEAMEEANEDMDDHAEDVKDHLKDHKQHTEKTNDHASDKIDLHQKTDEAIDQAMGKKQGHDKLSGTPEDLDELYLEIYGTVDDYPEVSYEYEYQDDHAKGVKVSGIEDEKESEKFQSNLMKLNKHKTEILNKQDEGGVFYLTETEPSPKGGFDEFYNTLHANLEYPETAEVQGVEGTIVLKFKVDNEGHIHDVRALEKLDNVSDAVAEDLKKEAMKAVKETSGDWNPAEVGGKAVSQWVVLPVQFRIKGPYYSDLF